MLTCNVILWNCDIHAFRGDVLCDFYKWKSKNWLNQVIDWYAEVQNSNTILMTDHAYFHLSFYGCVDPTVLLSTTWYDGLIILVASNATWWDNFARLYIFYLQEVINCCRFCFIPPPEAWSLSAGCKTKALSRECHCIWLLSCWKV